MKIGWIGAGIMGNPMVGHLLKHKHEAHVYARHPEKVQNLVEQGAILENDIPSLVKNCDVICTMVGFPSDVKEVYDTIFKTIDSGKICIDFTTSSPELAIELAQQGNAKQVTVMDAPVTGGDAGAKQGTLTILVGGDRKTFDDLQSVFTAFGQDIYYCGEAGSGQKVKIANQIMIANTLQGICEAMAYLSSQGLDSSMVIDMLQNGAAGSKQLQLLGPKMLKQDFDPGFYIKHFVKDLRIATSQNRVKLTGVENVIQEYLSLMDQGYQDRGTQALIAYFQKQAQ